MVSEVGYSKIGYRKDLFIHSCNIMTDSTPIEESNLALIGTDEDRAVKKVSIVITVLKTE